MPVIPAAPGWTHQLPHARFVSLATPTRGARETSVWRVLLEPDAPALPHRLTREEVFVVLSGSVRVLLEGQSALARAGDAIVVPPDTEFALGPEGGARAELLCCFPVGGKVRIGDGDPFTPPWAE